MTMSKQPEDFLIVHMVMSAVLGAVVGGAIVAVVIWHGPVAARDQAIADLGDSLVEMAKCLDAKTAAGCPQGLVPLGAK